MKGDIFYVYGNLIIKVWKDYSGWSIWPIANHPLIMNTFMTHNALFVFKVSNEREIDWNQLLNSIDCKARVNIFQFTERQPCPSHGKNWTKSREILKILVNFVWIFHSKQNFYITLEKIKFVTEYSPVFQSLNFITCCWWCALEVKWFERRCWSERTLDYLLGNCSQNLLFINSPDCDPNETCQN